MPGTIVSVGLVALISFCVWHLVSSSIEKACAIRLLVNEQLPNDQSWNFQMALVPLQTSIRPENSLSSVPLLLAFIPKSLWPFPSRAVSHTSRHIPHPIGVSVCQRFAYNKIPAATDTFSEFTGSAIGIVIV
jgi:hypothetical protein